MNGRGIEWETYQELDKEYDPEEFMDMPDGHYLECMYGQPDGMDDYIHECDCEDIREENETKLRNRFRN